MAKRHNIGPGAGATRRLFGGRARDFAAVAAMAWGASACEDNLTHPVAPDAYVGPDVVELTCVPNLDREIGAAELTPTTGVTVSYLVSPAGVTRAVDPVGVVDGSGRRVWDLTLPDGDPTIQVKATPIGATWFAASFPSDAVAVPLDAAQSIDAVYRHDADRQVFELLGLASHEENPAEGKTLWQYEVPVVLYRFPLKDGARWTSVGEVRNGLVRGLPYAGRDTYEVEVAGSGRLELPDATFSQVLRVRNHLVSQPAVGAVSSRWQVSFLFECFGEVARMTSASGEASADFTSAAEVRRFGL